VLAFRNLFLHTLVLYFVHFVSPRVRVGQ
jgi:hypothetical protein